MTGIIKLNNVEILGSGSILQIKTDTYDIPAVEVTTTANDFLADNLEVTITPSSTSNTLLVNCFIPKGYNMGAQGNCLNSGFRWDASFSGNGTQLGGDEFVGNAHGGFNANTNLTVDINYFTTATAPAATAIKIRPWLQGGGGTYRIGGNGIACLTVTEIKA